MPLNQTEFLRTALLNNKHAIAEHTQEQLLQYLHLMRKWNTVFNLTSIRDPQEMVMLHLIDSLAIGRYLHGSRIIDIGTGAGLPGIPLALTHPDKFFTLLDSNNKKTRFLTQAVAELKLKNVEIIHARVENFRPEQSFDSILSRAFASLRLMLSATQHLLHEQGQFLAMKGTYPEQEVLDIPHEFELLAVHKLTIKGLNAERHLVCLQRKPAWEKQLP